jgi:hypothetical protein
LTAGGMGTLAGPGADFAEERRHSALGWYPISRYNRTLGQI